MMTPTRIVRMIGIAGLVGWMGMVGWVAKTTQAQNGGQAAAPLPPVATRPETLPQAGSETLSPAGDVAAPVPVVPDSVTAAAAEKSASPPPPLPTGPAQLEPADAAPAPPARRLPNLVDLPSASSSDDPEQAAQSFVERNQKEAEDHLKALTAEAQQLRARLAKLESGIKKWQGLVNALKSSQGQSVASSANVPGAEDAGDLEPIKPAHGGGTRADKRLKWATATSPAATSGAAAGGQPGYHVEPPQQQPAAQPQPLQVVVPGYVPR